MTWKIPFYFKFAETKVIYHEKQEKEMKKAFKK